MSRVAQLAKQALIGTGALAIVSAAAVFAQGSAISKAMQ